MRTEPAHVSVQSEPTGASVYRDGEAIGLTPLDMLVQPEEELVRVELRLVGYQPLSAELTATDGERLLKLSPQEPLVEPKVEERVEPRKRAPARTLRRRRAPRVDSEPATPGGPYERFE
jgi:hypothetical protein